MQASRPQTAPQEAAPTPRPLVIYDLDRTITVAGTYTPFLLFAARRLAPAWEQDDLTALVQSVSN